MLGNPGFENGAVAWGYAAIADAPWAYDVAHVVRRARDLVPPRQASDGEWLAYIEQGVDQQHILYQPAIPFGPFDPTDVISASLTFDAAIITEAPADGIEEHPLAAFFLNVADGTEYKVVRGSIISEEGSESGVWYRLGPFAVKSALAPTLDWPASFLAIVASMGVDPTPTQFLVDNVSLTVCWRDAPNRLMLPALEMRDGAFVFPIVTLGPQPDPPASKRLRSATVGSLELESPGLVGRMEDR